MLSQYVKAAMHHAHYERMENGRYFGSIEQCPGLWAEGITLEACRDELESTLESWLIIKLRHGDVIAAIDGVDINLQPEYAEAD